MGNWFKNLMYEGKRRSDDYNKKMYNLYDKEGCSATGKIICDKGDCKCHECDIAEQFLKTGKKVDTYNNDYKNLYRGKDLNELLSECEQRLNYSKELLDEIYNLANNKKDNYCNCKKDNNLHSNYKWIKNDNYYSQKNNKNIHLSKAKKEKIREFNILHNNIPKEPYIYEGNEVIDTDFKTYLDIHWNDKTTTTCVIKFGDKFNYGYGILIATAKKFVKNLNLDLLETIVNYNKIKMIAILELLVLNTAGKKCLNDIRKEAQFG